MAFDLQTYKEKVGQLDTEGLDLSSFARDPLSPDVLRCLRYMHDVEQHTSCYLRNLLNTKAHLDPGISAFLTLWAFEEYWHGEALSQVLAAHGEPAGGDRIAPMRQRLGWKLTTSPVVWMAFSTATRDFLAVHMTFGVINEWTTQAGYARVRAISDNPVLDDLLARIMKQEGRHIDYYLTQARERLEGNPRAQRTTRRMLRLLWDPVGSKVMPAEETHHLVRTLFSGPEGEAVAARVDRRIDRLPGLDGLGLVDKALATLR